MSHFVIIRYGYEPKIADRKILSAFFHLLVPKAGDHGVESSKRKRC
jgi:hypothetical protein